MTQYKVNSAKFAGHAVGDVVSAGVLDPKLNLDALVASGVLSVVGESKKKNKSNDESVEASTDEGEVSDGEDRSY